MLNVNLVRRLSNLMALSRLFSPASLTAGCRIVLDVAQSRYLSRALRLNPGDHLVAFDGRGGEYVATVIKISKNAVEIETGEHVLTNVESQLRITLVQSISKGDRMNVVVQKATELGVQRVVPVFSEHSVVRLDNERTLKRREHWQRIAQSACEQCGRNIVPAIDSPVALTEFISSKSPLTRMILDPTADIPLAACDDPGDELALIIGPEGGFSNAEYRQAHAAEVMPVSMGPRILRTETAAIVAIGAAQALWGDAGSGARAYSQ